MEYIDLEDVPESASGGGASSPILDELMEFAASPKNVKAAKLKEYKTPNSARTTVSRLNKYIEEEELTGIRALSRGMTVYLIKEK